MPNTENKTKIAPQRKKPKASLEKRTEKALAGIDTSLPISQHLRPELRILIMEHDTAVASIRQAISSLKNITKHTARILTIHKLYNL